MKLKGVPTAVLSTQFFWSITQTYALDYQVQKGDTFTRIARNYSRTTQKLSYSQSLAIMLRLNNKRHLSDFDLIKPGQVIKIPEQSDELEYLEYYRQKFPPYWNPSTWKIDTPNKYVVKPGDSLGKIAQKLIPNIRLLGKRGSLKLLLKVNKAIINIDKIFAGQELVIPSEEEILAHQKGIEVERLPAKKFDKKAWLKKTTFEKNFQSVLDDFSQEVWKKHANLRHYSIPKFNFKVPDISYESHSRIQFQCYKMFNKELLRSADRMETLKSLKNLLDLSRDFKHDELEHYYLKLISVFLKVDREELFLRMLNRYFLVNYSYFRNLKYS